MRKTSLKNTLLIAVAVMVIGTGLIVSQVVAHRYNRNLLEAAEAQAENIAHKLALEAADKILINDLVSLQKMLDDQLAANIAIAYLFVSRDGRILSHTFKDGVPTHLVHANASISHESGHLKKIKSERNERYIDIAWPIFEGKAGTLRLGLSEKPYRQRVTRLWLQMSAITVGVLLIALIACRVLIHRLLRPILRLKDAAEKIAAGNLDIEVDVKGRSEVAALETSFNRMLARLKDYMQRLEKTNQQLENNHLALDRAHRQLRTSFEISQQIAALPDLNSVCAYLVEKFNRIVACDDISLLVFGMEPETLFLFKDRQVHALSGDAVAATEAQLSGLQQQAFLNKDALVFLPLYSAEQPLARVAVFPFRHHRQLMGALVIGCPGQCRCVKKELDIIDLILNQAAGAIQRAVRQEEEIRALRDRIEPNAQFSGLVGKDPRMQMVYKLIEDVAPTDATVLIQGESGTGKELVARAIHEQSPRAKMPLVVINCSAYPTTLLESELFGHEKGAFTGAVNRKIGRFEQADGGTVFLDEIGEISTGAQLKLLRILQSRSFERLGSGQTIKVDVRILAATNRELLREVENGNFREDLFYRLNVIPVNLPPLCKRINDIPLLAQHFLKRFAAQQGKQVTDFSSEAMRILLDYPWPGNVRELENTVEHAVVLAKDKHITISDLPATIVSVQTNKPQSNHSLASNEIDLIRGVLQECDWNKTAAAYKLGISRSTLYEKIKKYRISKPTLH
jgi:DNA-binding NtrC family response regulator/HAMP domain-containing protein